MNYYIGVDIGGTKICVALIDKKGDIFFKKKINSKDYLDPDKAINKLIEITKHIQEEHKEKKICGIGIGAAGIILHDKGIIKFSPNLRWRDVYITHPIAKATGLPVVIDNDANAAGWGIYYLQYYHTLQHFLCVTLGTGIGGGLVLNGNLYRGATGSAGEIGHMTLIPNGLPCLCGNFGCIERYAGTKGIVERTLAYIDRGEKTIITDLAPREEINPLIVSIAAEQKDALAIQVWQEIGEMIGTTISSVINLLNLELIYFTGGFAQAKRWIRGPIKDTIYKRAFTEPGKNVKIVFGQKRRDIGVIGSGLLALEKKFI